MNRPVYVHEIRTVREQKSSVDQREYKMATIKSSKNRSIANAVMTMFGHAKRYRAVIALVAIIV